MAGAIAKDVETVTQNPILRRIEQRLPTGRPRSRLGQFLTENRDDFADLLARTSPTWADLAEAMVAEGVMDAPDDWTAEDAEARRRARLLAADTLRKAWERVQGQALKTRTKKTGETRRRRSMPLAAPAVEVRPQEHAPPAAPAPAVGEPSPASGEDAMTKLRRQINERSGRKT